MKIELSDVAVLGLVVLACVYLVSPKKVKASFNDVDIEMEK